MLTFGCAFFLSSSSSFSALCWWAAVCECVCVNGTLIGTKQREKFWDDIRRKWYYVRINDDKLKCNGIFFWYNSNGSGSSSINNKYHVCMHGAHTIALHEMLNSKTLFIRSLIRRGQTKKKQLLRNGMTITKSIKPNSKNQKKKKTLTCTCSKFNFYQLIVYVMHIR